MSKTYEARPKVNWGWVLGILFLLVGIGSLSNSIFGGALYILIGLAITPKTAPLITNNSKLKFLENKYIKYPLIIFLLFIAFNLVREGKEDALRDEFSKNSASIIADIQKEIDSESFSKANSKISKYIEVLRDNEDLKKLKELSAQKEASIKKENEAKDAANKKKEEDKTSAESATKSANNNSENLLRMMKTVSKCAGFYSKWLSVATAQSCANYSQSEPMSEQFFNEGPNCFAVLTDKWYRDMMAGKGVPSDVAEKIKANSADYDSQYNLGISKIADPTTSSECKTYVDNMTDALTKNK